MNSISFAEYVQAVMIYDWLYLYGALAIILIFYVYLNGKKDWQKIDLKGDLSVFIVIVLVAYFGTYPYEFGADRHRYTLAISGDGINAFTEDFVWMFYTIITGKLLGPVLWLILTAAIYVYAMYYYSRYKHKNMSIIMLMGFLGFLFLKAYAVNTMRAGFASALLFYTLTWQDRKKWIYWLLMFMVIHTHFSFLLPVGALILSQYYPKTKYFFVFWLLCIPMSFVAGTFFQQLFEPYLADYSDKAIGYLIDEDERYKSGFRWDFIFYSVIPVLMGYYYIYKKQIKDTFYNNIFNTYLIANSFWILVVRANFSDRMAYLSWIFIPVLMLYPPLKYKIWKRQNKKIAYILLGQELFTFMLSIR